MVMSDEAVDASVAYTDSMDTLKRTFTGVKTISPLSCSPLSHRYWTVSQV